MKHPVYFFINFLIALFLASGSPVLVRASDQGESGSEDASASSNAVQSISSAVSPSNSPDYAMEPVFNSRIYIRDSGHRSNETIVLVHGIGPEASTCFDGLLEELTNRYHVITFDLPGFGRSSGGNHLYSPDRFADFLKWVVDTRSGGRVILAGHSLGGALALKYAARYPESVSQLILVDVAGILHWTGISKFMVEISPVRLSAPMIPGGFTTFLDGPVESANDFSASLIYQTKTRETARTMRGILNNALSRKLLFGGDASKIAAMSLILEDFTDVLSQIRSPCRILWGELDTTTPLRTARLLHYSIAGSTLRVIPDSGHSPMFDNPQQFNDYFLEALLPDREFSRPPFSFRTNATLECVGANNRTYSGIYGTILIENSINITLEDITADRIVIRNSEVTMENARVESETTAMEISGSKLTVTGARISGQTAILTENSRLDLAGVRLKGARYAVTSPSTNSVSPVLFSVCQTESPLLRSSLHGIWAIGRNNPF